MALTVHFEDRDWTLDLDEIDLAQARYIHRNCGMTLLKLQEGLSEVNPEAMAALYWLMKTQNGVAVDLAKINFSIVKFGSAIADASERERAQELGVTVEELRSAVAEAERRSEAEERVVTVEEVLRGRGLTGNPTEAPPEAETPEQPTT
jgi:hypothetical protein